MEFVMAIGLLIVAAVVVIAIGIVFVMGLFDRREDPVEHFLAERERTVERKARRAF